MKNNSKGLIYQAKKTDQAKKADQAKKTEKPVKLVRMETLQIFRMEYIAQRIYDRGNKYPLIKIIGNCSRCEENSILYQNNLCFSCLTEDFNRLRYLQNRGYLFNMEEYKNGTKKVN